MSAFRRLGRLLVASALLIAAAAPAQDLVIARAAARCDSQIEWITDGFNAPDAGGPVPITTGSVDRGALLDRALKRAAEEKKLVFWYVPRIHGPQMYRPGIMDDYLRVVAFTDPWLVAILKARFVPLRMAADKAIGARTGVAALDWVEPAFAILTPDGKIVRRVDRIRTLNSDWIRYDLMRTLAAHADLAPPPEAAPNADPVAECRRRLGIGWPAGAEQSAAEAEKTQGGLRAAEIHAERGWIHIARLDGDGAFDEAKAAAFALPASDPDGPDAETVREGRVATMVLQGYCLLRRGEPALAAAVFAKLAVAPTKRDDVAPWALYRLASCHLLAGDVQKAEIGFRSLVAKHPDSPFAWMAASNLIVGKDTTPIGPAFHAFEDPYWPPKEAVAAADAGTNTQWPRKTSESGDVVRRALDFLLRTQTPGGGWTDARYAYWDTPRIIPNAWEAISGAAMTALLDWRSVDPKRVDAALKKGEKFLLREANLARGQHEECYADAFRLVYLAKKAKRGDLNEKAAASALARMNGLVVELARQQADNGSFGHEYPNPFTTAAIAVALDHARASGATVPDSVFAAAAKALASCRSADGAFSYGMGGVSGLKDSMARNPVCERALLFAKPDAGVEALAGALDNWDKYLPRLEKIRLCDFHSDGELGGFFFWHASYFTSEAMRALPADARGPHAARLLEHVCRIGEFDGSFLDSHEVGKSYGTAMALMTLRNLVQEP